MEERRLGRSGLRVSRLALGTMTWGHDGDDEIARDQLVTFLESGGTLVDSAAGYGHGVAEEMLGLLLGSVVSRDQVVVASRAGTGRPLGSGGADKPADGAVDTSRRALLDTLDASLTRLGTDHVDLWLVHGFDSATPLSETLSALDFAVDTGRARYVGVASCSGWQLAGAATWQRAVPGRELLATEQRHRLTRVEDERDVRVRELPGVRDHAVAPVRRADADRDAAVRRNPLLRGVRHRAGMEGGELVRVEVRRDVGLGGVLVVERLDVAQRHPVALHPLAVWPEVVPDGAHRVRVAVEQPQVVGDVARTAAEVAAQGRHDEGDVQQVDLVRQDVVPEAPGVDHHRVVGKRAAD